MHVGLDEDFALAGVVRGVRCDADNALVLANSLVLGLKHQRAPECTTDAVGVQKRRGMVPGDNRALHPD
jgi:hypothetical protein